jgi:integrase
VAHPVFKTGRPEQPSGWMVRFHRRSVAVNRHFPRLCQRRVRFHDLRHTFGTLAVRKDEIPPVQAWMGHAHVGTTMRYIHHRDPGDEAKLLAEAFAPRSAESVAKAS